MALDSRLRALVNESAGVYFLVTDNSTVPEIIEDSKLRLMFLNEESGPVNALVKFNKGDIAGFESVFGKAKRKNEKNGNFGIKVCEDALTAGPIAVMNIRKFDDERDKTQIGGIKSTFDDDAEGHLLITDIPYQKLFDRNGFWSAKPSNISSYVVNPALSNVPFLASTYLNFGNIGVEDMVVLIRKSTAEEVDNLTSYGDSTLEDCPMEIDEYPAIDFSMKLRDTFVTVYIFKSSLASEFGELSGLDDLNAFIPLLWDKLAEKSPSFVRKCVGSVIPDLLSETKASLSIDTLVNIYQTYTGIILDLNKDLLEDEESLHTIFDFVGDSVLGYMDLTDFNYPRDSFYSLSTMQNIYPVFTGEFMFDCYRNVEFLPNTNIVTDIDYIRGAESFAGINRTLLNFYGEGMITYQNLVTDLQHISVSKSPSYENIEFNGRDVILPNNYNIKVGDRFVSKNMKGFAKVISIEQVDSNRIKCYFDKDVLNQVVNTYNFLPIEKLSNSITVKFLDDSYGTIEDVFDSLPNNHWLKNRNIVSNIIGDTIYLVDGVKVLPENLFNPLMNDENEYIGPFRPNNIDVIVFDTYLETLPNYVVTPDFVDNNGLNIMISYAVKTISDNAFDGVNIQNMVVNTLSDNAVIQSGWDSSGKNLLEVGRIGEIPYTNNGWGSGFLQENIQYIPVQPTVEQGMDIQGYVPTPPTMDKDIRIYTNDECNFFSLCEGRDDLTIWDWLRDPNSGFDPNNYKCWFYREELIDTDSIVYNPTKGYTEFNFKKDNGFFTGVESMMNFIPSFDFEYFTNIPQSLTIGGETVTTRFGVGDVHVNAIELGEYFKYIEPHVGYKFKNPQTGDEESLPEKLISNTHINEFRLPRTFENSLSSVNLSHEMVDKLYVKRYPREVIAQKPDYTKYDFWRFNPEYVNLPGQYADDIFEYDVMEITNLRYNTLFITKYNPLPNLDINKLNPLKRYELPQYLTSYESIELNTLYDLALYLLWELYSVAEDRGIISLNSYKPVEEQFIDGTMLRQNEILDIINEKWVTKGLKDVAGLRYIVDTFKSYVENEYKHQYALLADELHKNKRFVSCILNEPFIEDFLKSTNPLYKNTPTDEILAYEYLPKGGNEDFSTISVEKISNMFCYFFGPGDVIKHMKKPLSGIISNNFYNKEFEWDIIANKNGYLTGVTELEENFSDDDRKYLEKFRYNPVIDFGGITIFGNNSSQKTNSKTQQIHNVETLCYIKENIYRIVKGDSFTKATYDEYLRTETEAQNFMNRLSLLGAIKANPKVQCNLENNTEELQSYRIKYVHVEYYAVDCLEKVVVDIDIY